jgi:penicillin-binding protein 2
MTEGNSRFRLGVIGIVVMALFTGLFVRLWFLQIGSSKSYAAQTVENRVRVITEPAIRGSILDREGKIIVESELVNTIQIKRGLTDEQRKDLVPRLAEVLGITEHYINTRLDSGKYSPYQPVPIKDDVPYDQLVYLLERPELFPKVDVIRRSIRSYPNGSVAPHLLGYVGAVNADEAKLHKGEGYGPDDVIGKVGVEQVFESELRGEPRKRKLEVDSHGRLVRQLSDHRAQAGNDVQLTLDLDVQRIVEESLQQGMDRAGGLRDPTIKNKFQTYGAKGGAAVVLDATDGSVVALSSKPDFDITRFTDGIPVEEFDSLTNKKSNNPLLDRAISGQYAPGSTFKLFTAIAALESGVTTATETILDKGEVKFGNTDDPGSLQTFKNAGNERHGPVQLTNAIAVSSDVYFYTMGFRFWKEGFNKGNRKVGYAVQHVAKRFGFGKKTGVGLANELPGRIPDQKFKENLNESSTDESTKVWLPGDSAALSVGQGDLLVTPMQLAIGYAAYANGGKVYSPRLAQQILTPGGETSLRELPVQNVESASVKQEDRDSITTGLCNVVIGQGTAGPAFLGYGGLKVCGKTGTAEVLGKQDTSVFAAIVNADLPVGGKPCEPVSATCQHQYVVVVFVEEGGNGGSVAAPIVRRICEGLSYYTAGIGSPTPAAVRLIPPKEPGGDR